MTTTSLVNFQLDLCYVSYLHIPFSFPMFPVCIYTADIKSKQNDKQNLSCGKLKEKPGVTVSQKVPM